ncbi:MAG: DUF4912 domain-containing protein [Alphaproteobacteria bacterium]|uniref:DUF4912 domain-containing protein n=1 Tax=Candidatus Nitrobium versatile TaxID=2884831 RepID=A0A953J9U9_9BACT|nr:DUF4912 domain-containing protein [Candidatus Nitrobium versatile]
MKKRDLAAKGMAELRVLAREMGIKAGRSWKKEDFVKALTGKKVPAKKVPEKKVPARVTSAKGRPSGRPPGKPPAVQGPPVESPAPEKGLAEKEAVAAESRTSLERMTMGELRSLARERKIPLKRGYKKADILALIVKEEERKAREVPPPAPPSLPSEYREDKVVTMAVTPKRLYLYWEVTENTLAGQPGSLNLKIINTVTGDAFYLPISERVGEYFVSVSPGYAYTAEIGVIDRTGEFTALVTERGAALPPKSREVAEVSPAAVPAEREPRGAAPAREKQKEPSSKPPEKTEPVPRVISIIFAPSQKAEEELLPEAEIGRPEDVGLGIPEEYPSGVLETGGLPGEFFAVPEFISSAEAGAAPPEEQGWRGHGERGLPEEFFGLPESISSY